VLCPCRARSRSRWASAPTRRLQRGQRGASSSPAVPCTGRLVAVGQTEASDRQSLVQFSFRNFADLREQWKSFERLAAWYSTSLTLTGQGEAVRIRGAVATSDLFPLLGVKPALGRTFLPEEEQAGGGAQGYPAILGWESWQQYSGGDSGVIGRSITLSGKSVFGRRA
jgi:hypothetical protein